MIGLGLIGGSLAWSLSAGGKVSCVFGVDRDPQLIEEAQHAQAIHTGSTRIQDGVLEAELVVLAVPPGILTLVARDILPYLKRGSVLTDVGSTKEKVVGALEAMLPEGVEYVGGHPMSGSENSGFRAADRYLFENAVYALTPTDRTSAEAVEKVRAMVEMLGARPFILDPATHDRIMAAVSHLPHVLAAAMVNTAAALNERDARTLALSAGGFRDTTRVAGGDPRLWADICLENKERLLEAMDCFRAELDILKEALENGARENLVRWLSAARETRERIPKARKGLLPALYELIVAVPDRPGVIGEMAQAIGQEGINIADIEILRVREGEGGSIRIGFTTDCERYAAERILSGRGIEVRVW